MLDDVFDIILCIVLIIASKYIPDIWIRQDNNRH